MSSRGKIKLPGDWKLQRVNAALSESVDWSHGFFGLEDDFRDIDCSDISVGVLDTGVDLRHPDIKCEEALDFTGTDPGDAQGHGTWCVGFIGALPNSIGVVGITASRKAGTAARMHSYKILGNDGSGFNHAIYGGLEAAIDHKLDIISCSWGGGGPDPSMLKLFKAFIARGGYVFAAAGNSGNSRDEEYPAKFPEIPGIAAVDKRGRLTTFSCYGPGVICCAPGYEMLSTIPGGYGVMSGTSMATPCVAGIAAKVLAATLQAGLPRPSLVELCKLIQDFATIKNGLRIINPQGLVKQIKKAPPPPEAIPGKWKFGPVTIGPVKITVEAA